MKICYKDKKIISTKNKISSISTNCLNAISKNKIIRLAFKRNNNSK